MSMVYLILVLVILFCDYLLALVADLLNVSNLNLTLPQEFKDYYSAEKYVQSQKYLKENTYFQIASRTFFLIILLVFIFFGGFNYLDIFARSFNQSQLITGLIFAASLFALYQLLEIPFNYYQTFVLEAKYGFNRTTHKTFYLDIIRSLIINLIVSGLAFAFVVWIFLKFNNLAWFYCWWGLVLFQLFIVFISPVLIMPLFNKFAPLADGELKEKIFTYAKKINFNLNGIFTMDGSRRSAKSNAFFTGLGRYRRIVLFDTLIAQHTSDELVAVLAHEMGHYKQKHILKMLLFPTLAVGIMFYLLSWFINNPDIFAAFKMEHLSVYASLIFFGFLYSPINLLFSIFLNILSRRHEFEADAYSRQTYGRPEALISALKKLSVDNLSNLTPHSFKVFLSYSHPPVLRRIARLKAD